MQTMTPAQRFWKKVNKSDECWLWMGARTKAGYGNFALDARHGSYRFVVAHRYAYEVLVGPVPVGMQLDHLCRVRHCVNPAHLEPVTNQENTRRGLLSALKTECVNGHPWTPENTVVQKTGTRPGRRRCRTCVGAQNRKTAERRKAERACQP